MSSIGPAANIWHYDGQSATRHFPSVLWDGQGVSLRWDGGESGPHRWSSIVALGGTGGQSAYGLKGEAGWRLVFAGSPPADFAIHLPLPARYGRWIDRIGLTKAIALFSVLAALTVLLVLRAPGSIAGDLGGRVCSTPASRAALDTLATRLGGGPPVRVIEIVNVPMVNAVALPGGRILIFDGLLAQAKSPDELAGILAHEIGHVRNRDTMAAMVRQLGLSVVLGGLNGQVGGVLNGLLSLSYSRDAERNADGYSIAALKSANISPEGVAGFFDRMGGGKKGEPAERAMSWMASHPVSAERKSAFLKSKVPDHSYEQALTPAQWHAMLRACRDDKTVKPPVQLSL
jgi:hypothetical protein